MAKRTFKNFVPRPKPRKRPGRHKKSLNKNEKRSYKKYNRQGRRAKQAIQQDQRPTDQGPMV